MTVSRDRYVSAEEWDEWATQLNNGELTLKEISLLSRRTEKVARQALIEHGGKVADNRLRKSGESIYDGLSWRQRAAIAAHSNKMPYARIMELYGLNPDEVKEAIRSKKEQGIM